MNNKPNDVRVSLVGPVGKYDEVLKPFTQMMEKELHANSGKGDRPGWLSMPADTCLLEIYYHLGKLQKAVKDGNGDGICEYAADVANLSMMLTDICGALALFATGQPADQQGAPPRATEKDIERWHALIAESPEGPWVMGNGGSFDRQGVKPISDELMSELGQWLRMGYTPWNGRSVSPTDRQFMYLLYYSVQGLVSRVRRAERDLNSAQPATTTAMPNDWRSLADMMQSVGAAYWLAAVKERGPGAVQWLHNEDTGAMFVFTRGEYAEQLKQFVCSLDDPATAKVDENTEFEIWRNDQIESLERMGYQDAAKAFRNLGSVHWTGWQARANLNGGQS